MAPLFPLKEERKMARFNRGGVSQVGYTSPVQTTEEREVSYEGHQGWARTPKSELFLLACSFMGGDDNFYEKSDDRYARLVSLVNDPSVYTDIVWLCGFVGWVRNTANMRTVALVIAVEAVVARLANDLTEPVGEVSNRRLIDVSMSRADEPAEMVAYWNHKHGGILPQPFKAGIGDAVRRLYTEFSILKYGAPKNASVTAKDVLRVTHPKPTEFQSDLFNWIVNPDRWAPISLKMVSARRAINNVPRNERVLDVHQVAVIREAGFTWENLSEWNPTGMDARAWEVMIPRMGVFALLRNLRNFDQAGISDEAVAIVRSRLSGEKIRSSGVLPFQIYGAYRALQSVRWAQTLDAALTECCNNIPVLDGSTLVLVDMSQSMWGKVSAKSEMTYADAAAIFGAALKVANPDGVDLVQFGSEYQTQWEREYQGYAPWTGQGHLAFASWGGVTEEIHASRGASVLVVMSKMHCMGGTKIHQALAETFRPGKHTRVIILTDEQAFSSRYADTIVPNNVPVYIWNFAGYRSAVMQVGERNRHEMGGLTDNSFKMISILEAGTSAKWPWENA